MAGCRSWIEGVADLPARGQWRHLAVAAVESGSGFSRECSCWRRLTSSAASAWAHLRLRTYSWRRSLIYSVATAMAQAVPS